MSTLTASRIQRRRTKGWRMPPDVVFVGRPSRWGNPFKVGARHPRTHKAIVAGEAVELFREYALQKLRVEPDWLDPLRGMRLACWCNLDNECHADVLLSLVAIVAEQRRLAKAEVQAMEWIG